MAQLTVKQRYVILDKIGQGGMGVVYRAHDRFSGQTVALKQVIVDEGHVRLSTTSDSFDFRLALAQEFRLLASLRHPHILGVLDYGFDQAQPYFTSEYLENARNLVEFGHGQPLRKQVELLEQLLQALAYLHRRGIIHRDLKPDNVLVINDQVKVLDFGLAAARDKIQQNEETVGTLAYMAPEVLQGEIASEGSDLYAVGMIAYEMFAGKHPFPFSDVNAFIQSVLTGVQEFDSLDLPESITLVLQRLLSTGTDGRYPRAQTAIDDLKRFFGSTATQETAVIRESFLQAAAFIGRDQEFAQLSGALVQTRQGSGSAWMVGGESGVGKSRLLDELRTHALVEGMLVMRGQAVLEGGAPHQVLSDALRLLSLQTSLTPLEAGVIKGIVPDLESVLDHPIEDAPGLDGQTSQTRLQTVLEEIFRRIDQPMLLLLEDLQWAADSLWLVNHLGSFAGQISLMIVGSYRDDEVPNLPDKLNHFRAIKLPRLKEDSIAELSSAMLGEVGQQRQVIDLLQRETEGNVFFLIEVVRALAEGAGSLSLIGQSTLPASVFAGGIRTVIQHRLMRIPERYHAQLTFAAVAGRILDLSLIRAEYPDLDMDAWLLSCSEAAVLEVSENIWRFSHDKLREAIISGQNAADLRQIHYCVAGTIEAVYSDAPQMQALLAYHLEKSLDPTYPESSVLLRTITALGRAGSLALASNTFEDALRFYKRLFALEEQYRGQGQAIPDTQLAEWYYGMGQSQVTLRQHQEARHSLEKALDLLGVSVPQSTGATILSILNQLRVQLFSRWFPARSIDSSTEQNQRLTQVAQVERAIGGLYYILNKGLVSLYTSLHSLNVSERIGPSPELLQSYGMMVVMTGSFGMGTTAEQYYRRAQAISQRLNDPIAEAGMLFITSIHHSGQGLYERVKQDLEKSIATYERIGDAWQLGYSRLTYATAYFSTGNWDRAYQIYTEIDQSVQQSHILPHRVTAQAFMGRIDLLRGQREEALQKVAYALTTLEQTAGDVQLSINPWSVAAWIYYQTGDHQRAMQAVETVERMASADNTTARWGHVAFNLLFDIYLSMLEQNQTTLLSRDTLLERAQKLLRPLTSFAPPVSKGATRRSQARLSIMQGKPDAAIKQLHEAIRAAQGFNMPMEEALAHWELAHVDTAQQAQHRESAEQIFRTLGAQFYLDRMSS